MPKKTVTKSQQFSCPKCNQTVTFRYLENQFFADEINQPIGTSIDKVTHYGQCPVAANANHPHHPTHFEMLECPVYKEIDNKR
jgi:hypothetical protein